jgi:hypothetical protein
MQFKLTARHAGNMSIKRYNVDEILNQLYSCYYDANDPHMDGFFQWGRKQDLYRVKFVLEEMIASSSTFATEEEWLEEQRVEREQKRMLQILKK